MKHEEGQTDFFQDKTCSYPRTSLMSAALIFKGPVWLGVTVKQGGRTVRKDSGSHRVMTSILTMEVEPVTHAIQWHTDHTCHHSHRLNEPPAKGGV